MIIIKKKSHGSIRRKVKERYGERKWEILGYSNHILVIYREGNALGCW